MTVRNICTILHLVCRSKPPFPARTNKFVIRFIKDFVAGRPDGGEKRTDDFVLLSSARVMWTSLVVGWSELLSTNHEVPGSIPGSTMGIFPCRGRIPVVTMVWVVSRIRLKVETSVTRSHNSINSD